MKNIKILTLLILSLSLVGCSKETKLECEKISPASSGTFNEYVTLTYKDKSINYYYYKIVFEATAGEYIEDVRNLYLDEEINYSNAGLKSSYKIEGNKFIATVEGNSKDILEASINSNEDPYIRVDKTIDEYKADLIDEFYTCK